MPRAFHERSLPVRVPCDRSGPRPTPKWEADGVCKHHLTLQRRFTDTGLATAAMGACGAGVAGLGGEEPAPQVVGRPVAAGEQVA